MAFIRKAVPDDLENLLDMGARYASESPLTYDPLLARETIGRLIHTQIVLVEESGPVLSGFVFGYLERSFTVEICATISKFFVEKEFRGLGTSVHLVEGFAVEAKRQGASMIFTASHLGEMFGRVLSRRCGFTIAGHALLKEL